jgi:hypothetical protein
MKSAPIKKKPLTSHPTKKRKPVPPLIISSFKHLYSGMTFPVSQLFIDNLAEDLVKWSRDDEEAFKITQFLRSRGIHSHTFFDWCDRFPVLAEARKAALETIGDRREIGAIQNKYNTSMIMRQQHYYDEEWWTSEVKRAELKASLDAQAQANIKYTVVVDDYSKDTDTGVKEMRLKDTGVKEK